MKDLRYIVLWKCRTTSVSSPGWYLVPRNIPDSDSLVSNTYKGSGKTHTSRLYWGLT